MHSVDYGRGATDLAITPSNGIVSSEVTKWASLFEGDADSLLQELMSQPSINPTTSAVATARGRADHARRDGYAGSLRRDGHHQGRTKSQSTLRSRGNSFGDRGRYDDNSGGRGKGLGERGASVPSFGRPPRRAASSAAGFPAATDLRDKRQFHTHTRNSSIDDTAVTFTSEEHRREIRQPSFKRSQSVGKRMASMVATTSREREEAPAPSLLLYHVSRPVPRARWVFELSKHTNIVDTGPTPTSVRSIIDKDRPELGGLVWVNASLGNHCCLQKGTKTKTVTPVPPNVIDGWLNGQTGFWWIGALKDGHRTPWDSHVVMSWAMIFIPSSPEVATRNNMAVWRDTCLKGSLRVVRPGELERKIVDLVTDDQDSEPENVVHTHLCILLAEGDDLELNRPRMSNGSATFASSSSQGLKQYGSGRGIEADGNVDGSGSAAANLSAALEQKSKELEQSLDKIERYRERVRVLREDRDGRRSMASHLKEELREKESALTEENERLRVERDEMKLRARELWEEFESLRLEIDEKKDSITAEEATALREQVDRLRSERNDARAHAMRWLEEQQSSSRNASPAASPQELPPALTSVNGSVDNADARPKSQELPTSGTGDEPSEREMKAAAVIAKLKAKVSRLRSERDGAEKQAAEWLNNQQEKFKREMAVASAPTGSREAVSNGRGSLDIDANAGADAGGAGVARAPPTPGGPVVASLKAEGLKLQKELDDSRKETQLWRERAAAVKRTSSFSRGTSSLHPTTETANDTSEASPEARQALGHLLGHALNLGDSTTPNATAANGNAPGDSVLQGRAPAWTAQSRDTGDRLPSHKMGGDMESMSTANNSPQTPQSAQQVGIATIGVGA